jgi:hypothetical protein
VSAPRQFPPSDDISSEWVDRAARSRDPVEALLAVATAMREQVSYCPLPPGYRAVYLAGDGSFFEEPIVALRTDERRSDVPVICRDSEGFSTEGTPEWYLSPGEELNESIKREIRAQRARHQPRQTPEEGAP